MDKDVLQREIDYQINTKNNLWYALIVSIGGTLSLLINPDNKIMIALIVLGFLSSMLLINGYFKRNDIIEKLIDKMRNLK